MNLTVTEVEQEAVRRLNERDPHGLEFAVRKAIKELDTRPAISIDRRVEYEQRKAELERWLQELESEKGADDGEECE